jgi:hypothetical protein
VVNRAMHVWSQVLLVESGVVPLTPLLGINATDSTSNAASGAGSSWVRALAQRVGAQLAADVNGPLEAMLPPDEEETDEIEHSNGKPGAKQASKGDASAGASAGVGVSVSEAADRVAELRQRPAAGAAAAAPPASVASSARVAGGGSSLSRSSSSRLSRSSSGALTVPCGVAASSRGGSPAPEPLSVSASPSPAKPLPHHHAAAVDVGTTQVVNRWGWRRASPFCGNCSVGL